MMRFFWDYLFFLGHDCVFNEWFVGLAMASVAILGQ